jgi:iron complex outermembrane receptor protein
MTLLFRIISGGGASLLALSSFQAQAEEPQRASEASAVEPTPDPVEARNADDIVVTARRRNESLQDVPLAVTAFSAANIQERSIFNVQDIGRLAPNLSISSGRGGSGIGYIFIRGIGQADDNPSMDPGVSQYVDDVYLGRLQGGLIDLNDVRSVEVLRGPQGTLYGKNTVGGAVKVNSILPNNDASYYAQATYGNYNYVSLSAATSQPLVRDVLAIRLSGKYTRNDGYMRNAFDGQRLNNQDTLSGRMILRYTPVADVEALLSVDGARDDARPNQGRLVGTAATPVFGLINRVIGPIGDFVVQPGQDPWKGSFDVRADPNLPYSTNKDDSWGTFLRLSWTPGPVAVKSITSYRNQLSHVLKDVDSSPLRVANVADRLKQWQLSQEFQVSNSEQNSRFNWLGGLFYYKEHVQFDTTADLLPALIPLGVNQQSFRAVRLGTESYAAFLNVGYKITDSLSASIGARYTHEKKDILINVRRLSDGAATFGPASNAAKFDDFSPKIEIDYRFSPDVLAYASAAKGFKSGGFNGRAGVGAQLESFDPETAWTYETGVKSTWLDRRLTLNLAAFYTDYRDIQFQVISAVNGQLLQVVTNAGKGHLKGLELETTVRPATGLTFGGTLGLIDADFTQFFDARLGDLSRNKFQNTPKVTASVQGRYETAFVNDVPVAIQADYSFRSRTYFDPQNTAVLSQGNYGLLNARVSAYLMDRKLELAAFGKNLTNKTYLQNGVSLLDSFGLAVGYYGAPRTYGVQATLRY